MARKKKDAIAFTHTLAKANAQAKAKLLGESEAEAKETKLEENPQRDVEAEKEIFKQQLAAYESAKEKYMAIFAEKHVEFIQEKNGFYRLKPDGTYSSKPWHIYLDIEGRLCPTMIKFISKEGWLCDFTEDGRMYIYPDHAVSLFKAVGSWFRELFCGEEFAMDDTDDAEETAETAKKDEDPK